MTGWPVPAPTRQGRQVIIQWHVHRNAGSGVTAAGLQGQAPGAGSLGPPVPLSHGLSPAGIRGTPALGSREQRWWEVPGSGPRTMAVEAPLCLRLTLRPGTPCGPSPAPGPPPAARPVWEGPLSGSQPDPWRSARTEVHGEKPQLSVLFPPAGVGGQGQCTPTRSRAL